MKVMKNLYRYTPGLILACYILIFIFFKHPANSWERVINSDGKGYYAYLPAIFIYHDLDYHFIEYYEAKYYPSDKFVFKEFRVKTVGGIVNKCFPGLAILWLPFFFVAHLLSQMAGFEPDGYSLLYQYSIAFAALFYLWLGCRFLFNLITRIHANEKLAAFITLTIGLGTNLIYYTIIEGSMTHVYSFALVTLFLYSTFNLFFRKTNGWFILSAVLFSLIVLIRPVNGLIILLMPFMRSLAMLTGNQSEKLRWQKRDLITGFTMMLILFAIPLILWHLQTGKWIVYSYGDEHFNFSDPHFFSILFSYNRGWFVYTPIAFIALAGFPRLFKADRQSFFWLCGFLVIFIFISSCWWMWYYASKCGQRIFVDFLSLTGILLSFLFLSLQNKRKLKTGMTILIFLLIGLNLLQFYQHSRWIFPSIDIDRKTYWNAFFSLHPVARANIPDEAIIKRETMFNDMEKSQGWMNEWTITNLMAHSLRKSSLITRSHPYSAGLSTDLDSLFTSGNKIIRISAMVLSLGSTSGASLVADFSSGGKSKYYKGFYIEPFARPGKWTKIETAFYVPHDLLEKANVKIYFYLPQKSVPLFIDDMTIDFLSIKDEQIYSRLEGVLIPAD
jgi:hypothetical protein